MTIDPKYLDLIQADIDQETGPEEKAALEAFLAQSEEGRSLHQELTALAACLDEMEELPAPAHLQHVIMNSVTPRTAPAPRTSTPHRTVIVGKVPLPRAEYKDWQGNLVPLTKYLGRPLLVWMPLSISADGR